MESALEYVVQRCLRALVATVALLMVPAAAAGQGRVAPVVDLNRTGGEDSLLSGFKVLGDRAYFVADSSETGVEIWRTDGTEERTEIFVDLRRGPGSSDPTCLAAIDGHLYFAANDGVDGSQPWVSDGTEEGTRRLVPGVSDDSLEAACSFTRAGDFLFFVAGPVGDRGVWRTDGSADGTILLAPHPASYLVGFGSEVYYRGETAEHGRELWASDGTVSGTRLVMDIQPGEASSRPRAIRAARGGVVFVANSEGSDPYVAEVWRTDGTPFGTTPVFGVGNRCGRTNLVGDEVFFVADDGTGCAVVHTDGTVSGTEVLAVLPTRFNGGAEGIHLLDDGFLFSYSDYNLLRYDQDTAAVTGLGSTRTCFNPFLSMTSFGGRYYFRARSGGGLELFRTDGTREGTESMPPFTRRKTRRVDPLGITVLGDRLLFATRYADHGLEPWVSDGTESGTHLLKNINRSTARGVGSIRRHGGTVFLETTDEVAWDIDVGRGRLHRPRLWSTDGSLAGTVPVEWARDFLWATVLASDGDQTYFLGHPLTTSHTSSGWGLYVTDGTAAGVRELLEVGRRTLRLEWARRVGEKLVFSVHGHVWGTDGTPEGTVELRAGLPDPLRPVELDGALLFNHPGLWRTDGTVEGTFDLEDDLSLAQRYPLARVGPYVFLIVEPDGGNAELWRTDGTPGGSTVVRGGLLAGGAGFRHTRPQEAVAWRGELYFTLPRGQGYDLWRSDGTEAGTVRVAPISDDGASGPRSLTPAGDRFFLVMDDGVHGAELAVTDGTPDGTRILKDIRPGPEGSRPTEIFAVGSHVYFAADDGMHGRELWFSDGTEAGTILVQDVRPGPRGSEIRDFQPTESGFVFSADDGLTGVELFASTCGDGVAGPGEQCDLGPQNGSAGSCCTATCRLMVAGADLSETCSVDVERVSLRRRPGRGARGDRIVARGRIMPGVRMDASRGMGFEVHGPDGALVTIDWTGEDCAARSRGWRCRLGADAVLKLRRASDGSTTFHLRVRGLSLAEDMAGPLEIGMGPADGSRMWSTVASCRQDERRLVCRP